MGLLHRLIVGAGGPRARILAVAFQKPESLQADTLIHRGSNPSGIIQEVSKATVAPLSKVTLAEMESRCPRRIAQAALLTGSPDPYAFGSSRKQARS